MASIIFSVIEARVKKNHARSAFQWLSAPSSLTNPFHHGKNDASTDILGIFFCNGASMEKCVFTLLAF